jgi:hypothetical protein
MAILGALSWLLVGNHNLRKEVQAMRDQQANTAKTEQELRKELDLLHQQPADIPEKRASAQGLHLTASTIRYDLRPDLLRGNSGGYTPAIPHAATFVSFI